ncbi:MAG: hypothetical protein ACE5D1_08800 [Fidelibacterota bacterium]
MEKTSRVISRKIRSLVVDESELDRYRDSLDLRHALPIWEEPSGVGH